MIRIDIDVADLRTQINDHNANWLTRAENRTNDLIADPNLEITSIWSPIKRVFMDLQHSKCVFCEKEIEDQPIEQDVEHFRPKNNVKRWSPPNWMFTDENVVIAQPATGSEPGYRLLAYNFLNYAAACKTCNSTRKRDYFPIEGVREHSSTDPENMDGERAFLIFPVSDLDDDPEDLIEFHGLSPQAKQPNGFGRKRALVTIDLFQLDDSDSRSYLFKRRAQNICHLFDMLQIVAAGGARANQAQIVVDHLTSVESEHTNCLRCFHALYHSDFDEAKDIADAALILWTSGSS